jgi:hypothetical protein
MAGVSAELVTSVSFACGAEEAAKRRGAAGSAPTIGED